MITMMSKNSSLANSSDFFRVVSEDNPYKNVSIVAFTILAALIIPLLYGIFWFERFGSDTKRIFSNMLVVSTCWKVIECGIFVQSPCVIRYIWGPLPTHLCFFLAIVQSSVILDFFLLFDAMALARYAFIFWMKDPDNFQDQFWHRFTLTWIKCFSLLFQSAWHMTAKRQPMGYYICAGNTKLG